MTIWKHILLFVGMVALSISANLILDNWHYKEGDHRRLQKEINKKFQACDRIYQKLQENDWELDTPLPKSKGIIMLSYAGDSLKYWSDNIISFEAFRNDDFNDKHFDSISNAWYIIKPYITDSIRAFGLILVKKQYPYENDFLQNGFQPDLMLPSTAELLTVAQPGSFSIMDWEGIYLFSIKFSMNELRYAQVEKYLIPSLILLSLFCLLFLLHQIINTIPRSKIKNAVILFLPLFFAAIRWIQYQYQFPSDLYEIELFSPIPFGKSDFLPSLGEVFINSLLILFVVIEFYLAFKLPERVYRSRRVGNIITIAILIMVLTCFFIFTHFITSNLILHSVISFEFYKAATLNVYTFIGLIIMAMHFGCILFIANKLLMLCRVRCKFRRLLFIFTVISVSVFVAAHLLIDYRLDSGSYIAFVIIFLTLAIMQYRHIMLGNYTAMAFMVVIFSAYSVYVITHYDSQKTTNSMAVLAENLSAQHDGVAEYLLEDISDRLSKDETMNRYLFNENVSDGEKHNYLQNNYFNGFWGKYTLIFTECRPTSDILVNDTITDCYEFFQDRMVEGKSMQLPRTNFYFLDSQNGRINYLGWFTFFRPDSTGEISLFIELESRLVTEELGFPELLLDKKFKENDLLKEYSYAKYYLNQLLAQSGTFQYSLDLNTYRNQPAEFDGYRHYISDLNKDNVVIVSKPTTNFFNKVVSFSYIFIFYYVLILFFIFLRDFSKLGQEIQFNFKNKIQFSITALIFLSLFLVGGGTIYFSMEQYQNKQHDILSEKINSVNIELDHLLAYYKRIPPNWKDSTYASLDQLLIKFSDVFYSDINLYDPEGNLLATSRPQVINEGLLGNKMNPVAYSRMVKGKQAEFIHREKIGSQSYLSAYVPFVNALGNKILAYINLPYFTRQNVLRNEITTLVVAIVNVYVLLILVAIGMAALISDQITRPLRMIQQRFSQIKIGKKNEEIIYNGQDEIAGLVNEYNRMVRELARNVEMLARSERESAWREMAKQVAHEIKNPLTPMKLSVQHLQRSWNDNKENFDEYLQKVTRTLIEQIDTLSFIASEFSNFAKMPKAVNEETDIVESIRSTLNLFSNTENVDFVFEHESEKVPVFADREQLSRVFINLIKNAIQSIPDNRNGRIAITLVQSRSLVRITISDNGKGIPEDLQNKLFTPSFTTKSSGMGLGLTIVKSIIESFGGNITFNTKVNLGTTFIIELPVFRPDIEESRG